MTANTIWGVFVYSQLPIRSYNFFDVTANILYLGCSMNIFFLPRGAALLHGERDETALLHRSIRTGFFVPLRSNNALQIAFLRASVIDHPSADSSLARRGVSSSSPPPLLPVTRSPHIYHLPHTCQDPSKRVSYFDTVLLLIGTWCHYSKGTL